jgi:hypothetical protein
LAGAGASSPGASAAGASVVSAAAGVSACLLQEISANGTSAAAMSDARIGTWPKDKAGFMEWDG